MADPTGNEPAAPVVKTTETVQRVTARYRGLTKREHFAGMAMAGILANPNRPLIGEVVTVAQLAEQHADALLAELAKDGTP